MAKNKGKKDDGDDDKKIKDLLIIEIERLENLIYYEQEKEVSCNKELENILKKQTEEFNDIETLKKKEAERIHLENDSLNTLITGFKNTITLLEKEISEFEDDIKLRKLEVADLEKKNREELQKKDESINEQKSILDQMSIRFQLILQKTANKLQDRVDMGK